MLFSHLAFPADTILAAEPNAKRLLATVWSFDFMTAKCEFHQKCEPHHYLPTQEHDRRGCSGLSPVRARYMQNSSPGNTAHCLVTLFLLKNKGIFAV